MISRLFEKYRSLILYAFLGGTGALTDFVIYTLLVHFTHIPPVVANIISTSLGICTSFVLNSYFNFKKRDRLLLRFATFFAVGLVGIIFSALLIALFFNILGFSALVAKILTIIPVVLLQYVLNKHVSFSDDPQVLWSRVRQFIAQNPWLIVASLVMLLFIVNAPYYNFVDENDNLLGAQKMITDGAVIYKDYFSHHMPLGYYIALPYVAVFGTKLVLVKIAFGITMGVWLLTMSRHLRKLGFWLYAVALLGIALTQSLTWSHMILAETLVAFSTLHALILFLTRNSGRSTKQDGVVYGVLGAIPILSSMSFAPLSVAIYALFIIQLIAQREKKPLKPLLGFAAAAAVPFALFIGYLLATHSAGVFVLDAIKFNTQYYSQFTPEAGKGLVESMLTIPVGSLGGLYNALSLAPGTVQPFAFLWAASFMIGILYLIVKKQYLEGSVFLVVILFGAARSGFEVVFSGSDRSRAGIVIALLGMLLVAHVLSLMSRQKDTQKELFASFVSIAPLFMILTLTMLFIASSSQIAKNILNYKRGVGTIQLVEEAGSPSRVINIVNGRTGSYWLGPIDFSSQLVIQSKNASKYAFYPPWVAACAQCTNDLVADIVAKKPDVVVMDNSMSIWGIPVSSYDSSLMEHINKDYYQLPDVRLKQYYFRTASKTAIDSKLGKVGYKINEAP